MKCYASEWPKFRVNLGNDWLPFEDATPRPEGECCMGRFKRYAKHWMFDLAGLVLYPTVKLNEVQ